MAKKALFLRLDPELDAELHRYACLRDAYGLSPSSKSDIAAEAIKAYMKAHPVVEPREGEEDQAESF